MRVALEDRLVWATAWRLIVGAEAGVAGTALREVFDPLDGRTLVLSATGHPCELVLNQRRGVTILAPILIEERPWSEVVVGSLAGFVADVRATLGWPIEQSVATKAARMHAVMARILAGQLAEEDEYWLSSVETCDVAQVVRAFPLFGDAVAERFQEHALAGRGWTGVESWVLWRHAIPVAIFDGDDGVFIGGCRWDYGQLAVEVGDDYQLIANRVGGVLWHSAENFLLDRSVR